MEDGPPELLEVQDETTVSREQTFFKEKADMMLLIEQITDPTCSGEDAALMEDIKKIVRTRVL
jgi:hypothetical protein